MRYVILLMTFLILSITSYATISQETYATPPYDIGNPTLIDLYINPTTGTDANDGLSPESALQSVDTAWRRIPMGERLTTGYRLNVGDW